MTKVSVIIPYYQSSTGVLSKALASIYRQSALPGARIEVIIVDDESPQDPQPDIDAVETPESVTIHLVKRPNGGPSAARNTGLDAVSKDTDLIAFLDSDDEWTTSHIEKALVAMSRGADLFFEDHLTVNMGEPNFWTYRDPANVTARGLPSGLTAHLSRPQKPIDLPNGSTIFEISGEDAVAVLCQAFVAHVSTIVIRCSTLGAIRFDGRLEAAGEDYLYTFKLAITSKTVMYTDEIGAEQGKGVNMYYSHVGWGTWKSVSILRDNLLCIFMMQELVGPELSVASKLIHDAIEPRLENFIRGWGRAVVQTKSIRFSDFGLISKYRSNFTFEAATCFMAMVGKVVQKQFGRLN